MVELRRNNIGRNKKWRQKYSIKNNRIKVLDRIGLIIKTEGKRKTRRIDCDMKTSKYSNDF